jgi:hypothetical protein
VNGFKARIEAVYNNGPSAQIMYTNDNLYGSNLMVGVTMQFPFGNNHPTSGWKQNTPSPFRFVERNYNVIVDQDQTTLGNQVAVNPTTGNPYVVEQVYSPPSSGGSSSSSVPIQNGTAENPYSTVAEAQAAGGNLIFVQGGSVISTPITLTAGQHLLGQGNYAESLPVAGGGAVQMPNLLKAAELGNPAQAPVFTNISIPNANMVTLASNTEVAGFVFSGTTGDGIAGTNVSGTSLHDLTFLNTTGDSINLQNSSGDINLYNDQISGSTGNGIVINGGNANINYNGAGTSITTQGVGFELSNVTGGTVNIDNLTVKGTGGFGLNLDTVGTDVTVASFAGEKTIGAAVHITGFTGTAETVNGNPTYAYNTYNFTGNTAITSPQGIGFAVNHTDAIINVANLSVLSTTSSAAVSLVYSQPDQTNLGTSGSNSGSTSITFQNITLNTNSGAGLSASTLADFIVNNGTITTVNAPAVQISDSLLNTTFKSISDYGGSTGISIAGSTGVFTISGNGTAGSGGTIESTTTGLYINSAGTTNINDVIFSGNSTAIQSTQSNLLSLSGLQILNSTGYAIMSTDDVNLSLTGSTLSGNGTSGNGGTILVQADNATTFGSLTSLITNNTITDNYGTAIQFATTANGVGTSLATSVNSNVINAYYNGGAPIIGVKWNGTVSLQAAYNTINAYGSGMTGLLVNDASLTGAAAVQAQYNTITFEQGASSGTGISLIAGSTSKIDYEQNNLTFDAPSGIGFRFALAGVSQSDVLYANTVTDNAGGATGMLFDSISGGSSLTIEANTIQLLSTDLTNHQGIVFTAVNGTSAGSTINFSGSQAYTNYVNNAPTQSIFIVPALSATGGFYINGQLAQ